VVLAAPNGFEGWFKEKMTHVTHTHTHTHKKTISHLLLAKSWTHIFHL
jgi:hypothetical protein